LDDHKKVGSWVTLIWNIVVGVSVTNMCCYSIVNCTQQANWKCFYCH
jgi:hypothetical protein